MIQITIDENGGELCLSMEALELLTAVEHGYLEELGKKLKERRRNNDRV